MHRSGTSKDEKARRKTATGKFGNIFSHSACNLSATEAACADVNVLRLSIDDGFHTLDIRLPSAIGTSMRMAHFNSKSNTFAAILTFGHVKAPPYL